ncbi:hypothetical protein UCD39_13490 [Nitrospirillum sp. BR 11752]|uniref:hypothetical protein n=1 Tax=Nitrospirillum sp. BR 11752 TaxID=3104293 RepID=UPI002EAE0830|nr:hypothetical protein [Nitrospirillum sp. BR 11752]
MADKARREAVRAHILHLKGQISTLCEDIRAIKAKIQEGKKRLEFVRESKVGEEFGDLREVIIGVADTRTGTEVLRDRYEVIDMSEIWGKAAKGELQLELSVSSRGQTWPSGPRGKANHPPDPGSVAVE